LFQRFGSFECAAVVGPELWVREMIRLKKLGLDCEVSPSIKEAVMIVMERTINRSINSLTQQAMKDERHFDDL
jgi:hypothetical protein